MEYVGFFIFWLISIWIACDTRKAELHRLENENQRLSAQNCRLSTELFDLKLSIAKQRLRVVK